MTAHSALYHTVKVAGGGPSVHACAVFFRAKSRDGDKLGQTPPTPWRSRIFTRIARETYQNQRSVTKYSRRHDIVVIITPLVVRHLYRIQHLELVLTLLVLALLATVVATVVARHLRLLPRSPPRVILARDKWRRL